MNLLYVCTHNRCRSIICEAVSNHRGAGRLAAYSAGSSPAGEVHPLSLRYLAQAGYPTEGLQSQSWHDFQGQDLDLVLTVCDSAAGESCPLWLGRSVKLHWGLADPSKLEGSEAEIEAAFMTTITEVEQRVDDLLELPLEELRASDLHDALVNLGAR
ncbi:MAG: arsenate reductase ArsC [Pseudomonadota bacterium]